MTTRRIALGFAALLGVASVCPSSQAQTNFQMQAQMKATITQDATPSEAVGFDVFLPPQHKEALEQLLTELHTQGSAKYHQWLTPAQFQKQFGATPSQVRAMKEEFANYGLTATQASPHRLHVEGTAAAVQAALGASLKHGVMANRKQVMVANAALNVPHTVSDAGGVIADFTGVQRMRTHVRATAVPENRYSQAGGYWFDDLKQAYSWPSYQVVNGTGSTIGILVPGSYNQKDMDLYFGHEGLKSPKISVENVFGGSAYDPTSDGSFEAELDVQQSGGMAPNANIVVYSIPDLSDPSILGGLVQIVEDNQADVVNMSFGGPEIEYSAAYQNGVDFTGILVAEDAFFAEGNALGITFVASSGDAGALFPPPNCFLATPTSNPCGAEIPSANFPASSPHVTGVGGTNLGTVTHPNNASNLDSAYLYEEAFADPLGLDLYGTTATGGYWGSGGGDSVVFKKPAYQKLIPTGSKVRAVPDIALHMGGCPGGAKAICNPEDSYDLEVFGGKLHGVIGTSASSPDFAGLTALNVELQGTRLGNENYYIYALAAAQKAGLLPAPVYRNTIPGYNGLYTSGNGGYNRVLGVGTPIGENFLLLNGAPVAGKPQTPSNP